VVTRRHLLGVNHGVVDRLEITLVAERLAVGDAGVAAIPGDVLGLYHGADLAVVGSFADYDGLDPGRLDEGRDESLGEVLHRRPAPVDDDDLVAGGEAELRSGDHDRAGSRKRGEKLPPVD